MIYIERYIENFREKIEFLDMIDRQEKSYVGFLD